MAIVWKAQSVQNSRGAYWNIRARLDGKRINVSLGYVTEAEAVCAAEQMTLEERMGTSSRVRQWHKEDRESAVRYLVGDPAADELIEGKVDYARMALRQYFAEGFGEWRAKEAAASWRSERRLWDCWSVVGLGGACRCRGTRSGCTARPSRPCSSGRTG